MTENERKIFTDIMSEMMTLFDKRTNVYLKIDSDENTNPIEKFKNRERYYGAFDYYSEVMIKICDYVLANNE